MVFYTSFSLFFSALEGIFWVLLYSTIAPHPSPPANPDRKGLSKVLLEYMQRMHAMKKDSIPSVGNGNPEKSLKDTEGFDWLKFLLN